MPATLVTETLLTAAEAARAAGVSRSRVYAALTSGELPPAPGVVGNVKMLLLSDVRAWAARDRSKGGRPRKGQDSEHERRADRDRPQGTPAGD